MFGVILHNKTCKTTNNTDKANVLHFKKNRNSFCTPTQPYI